MSASKDFKEFVLRGNVVDLAVGVVIGAAFGNIVTAFVKDIVTPLIGIPGKVDLSNIKFTVNGSIFAIGDFLNTVISFLMISLVVFFMIVRPVNYLMSRRKTELPADPTTRECPRCLSSIPVKATRCAFCTSDVAA
jgi:large conductance mechanosensitive channel